MKYTTFIKKYLTALKNQFFHGIPPPTEKTLEEYIENEYKFEIKHLTTNKQAKLLKEANIK